MNEAMKKLAMKAVEARAVKVSETVTKVVFALLLYAVTKEVFGWKVVLAVLVGNYVLHYSVYHAVISAGARKLEAE